MKLHCQSQNWSYRRQDSYPGGFEAIASAGKRLILKGVARAFIRRPALTVTLFFTLCLVANVGAAEPIRVLYVGNSFTFYSNMPEMLKVLAAAHAGGPRFETQMVVAPGATLRQLWDRGEARSEIKLSRWDFVVLQQQTSWGSAFLVNELRRITSVDGFLGALGIYSFMNRFIKHFTNRLS